MEARRDVVVVGASAGGVEALCRLVGQLPADLAAPVLVVLHVPPQSVSALPAILSRSGPLPAVHATDRAPLEPGRIYVAPTDRHLLVADGHAQLSTGPAEHRHRPAIDPLFRSAARAYGPGAIGVVLSGVRDDGTAGLAAVVERGGTAVVQDPADALHPAMPRSAIEHVRIDHVLPADELGRLLGRLVGRPVDPATPPPPGERLIAETDLADAQPVTGDRISAVPSSLACPHCHGALFELDGAPAPRYRCRVGHAWSPESLLDEQFKAFEGGLWIALRALEERAGLSRRMTDGAHQRGSVASAARYRRMTAESHGATTVLRDLIKRFTGTADGSPASATSDVP